MVSSTSGIQSSNTPASFNFSDVTADGSVDSFAQHLLTMLEQYLGKSGNGAPLEIDIQGSPQSQNSDTRQFIVTVKNAAAAAPSTPSILSTTVAPQSGWHDTPMSWTPQQASAPAAPSSDPAPAADKSDMSPDDAYWAMQPPAVQALRTMPDNLRGSAAQALAAQGYTIDMPIMVWGWDPLATMVQRQIDGYTWVPSALQASIPLGPGLTFPGRDNYDPSHPPPGSIIVSTDFAIGTNGNNPAMKYLDTATT